MFRTIESLRAANYLTQEEAEAAVDAESHGNDCHTIGYELEILPSAGKELSGLPTTRTATQEKCRQELTPHGFGVDVDGLYELQSPAAKSPTALAIAMRGIYRAGWLPNKTRGLVTAHISIGSNQDMQTHSEKQDHLITMLRTVELLGHTTSRRLYSPVAIVESEGGTVKVAWNRKGVAGTLLQQPDQMENTTWEGKNNRTELRTLGYYSLAQFEHGLEATYFLSRGLMAEEGSTLRSTYDDLHDWLLEFYANKHMPQWATAHGVSPDDCTALMTYLRPYAHQLMSNNMTPLKERTNKAIVELREEVGMTPSGLASLN